MRFAGGVEGQVEKIIVQAKSGRVGVKDIREFRDVISRQIAAIGIFITLEQPMPPLLYPICVRRPIGRRVLEIELWRKRTGRSSH